MILPFTTSLRLLVRLAAALLCLQQPLRAGGISGSVTSAQTGQPLTGIEVTVYHQNFGAGTDWDMVDSTSTGAGGGYQFPDLVRGTYRIGFHDAEGNHSSEYYDNSPDLDVATDIVVPSEQTVTGINASLAKASRITGKVTGPDGTPPLADIDVSAYRWIGADDGYWDYVSFGDTDLSGNYSIGGLAAGTYRVEFTDWQGNYLNESFAEAVDLDSGTDIVVPVGKTVTGINASLTKASRITGKVTGPDGTTPLANIDVSAYRWIGADEGYWDYVSFGDTDLSGNYSIGGLAAGTYRVEFTDWQGNYLNESFAEAVDLDSGTDIVVPVGKIVTGINASLAKASRITGKVTGPDGTTPLADIEVSAYRWINADGGYWEGMSNSDTDLSGNYSIGGLVAGTYRVKFTDWQGNYLNESFSEAVDLDSGTDIVVPVGKIVTGINASLAKSSRITGKVTGPDGTTPLADIDVSAYRWINADGGYWEYMSYGDTDLSGNYSIGGLAAGTYRVQFTDWQDNYLRESFADAVDLDSGIDIIVPSEQTVTGIDASLASVAPPEPAVIVKFQKTSAGQYEIHYTGKTGQTYTIQNGNSPSIWTDERQHTCQSGLNIVPVTSSATSMFWRLKTAP